MSHQLKLPLGKRKVAKTVQIDEDLDLRVQKCLAERKITFRSAVEYSLTKFCEECEDENGCGIQLEKSNGS